MRFVPGTARSLFFRWAQKQSGNSNMNAQVAAFMFFDGTMPDATTIKQRFGAGMNGAARQANLYNVISPHQANYMGCVSYRQGITSALGAQISDIDLQLGFQADFYSANTDAETNPIATRQARIHRAGKPTWFALAVASGNGGLNCSSDNIPVQNNSTQLYIALVGTCGDEDSAMDLKIVGGSIALTQSNPVDLSKVPQIANLRLRLR